MLEAGLFQGACAKDLPQLVELNLFANVKLDEDEDRTGERRLDPSRRLPPSGRFRAG